MHEQANINVPAYEEWGQQILHALQNLGIHKKYVDDLQVLCKNVHDVNECFQNGVPKREKDIRLHINKWRKTLLTQRTFSLEDFLTLYEQDQIKALEELFLFPFCPKQSSTQMLIKHIENGELDLQTLFELQQKNPAFNPLQVVRGYLKY